MSKACEREWFGHAETVYFFKAIEIQASMVSKEHNGDGEYSQRRNPTLLG